MPLQNKPKSSARSIDSARIRPYIQAMTNKPDIAFEIWDPEPTRKEWQITVDRHVLGKYRTQLDAIEYAKTAAREAWAEADLHTVVVRCKADGKRVRIATFGDPDA
jgi:hypothetical protein